MEYLKQTKARLKKLGYPFTGIQLTSGLKLFGKLQKSTRYTLYILDKNGDILDVPRRIIGRAFILLNGGEDREQQEFLRKNKSTK